MTDIRAFIEERVADDERVALATTAREWSAAHGGTPRGSGVYVTKGSIIAEIRSAVEPFSHDAEHMARHDPARVLRDVEAKRRIVAQHETVCDEVRNPKSAEHYANARARQFQLDEVLRVLASVWAGHPDYDAGWAP